jgi:hypothetical protein
MGAREKGVGPGLKGKGGIVAGAQASMVGGRTLPVPLTGSGLGPPPCEMPRICTGYPTAPGMPLSREQMQGDALRIFRLRHCIRALDSVLVISRGSVLGAKSVAALRD